MSNRRTLMDDNVPRKFPSEGVREQRSRFPLKLPEQARTRQVRDVESKKNTPTPKSALSNQEKSNAVTAETHNLTQVVRNGSKTSYHEFMPLDQAGPAVIARENREDGPFVAIKRTKNGDRNLVHKIPNFTSDCLVNIKDMFLEGDEIVTIYEQMDVSLRHIMAVAGGPLQFFEIGAICKELIGGLTYLHEELSLYHGTLNSSNVLLNQNGTIKIANVAESILERKVFSTEKGLLDIKRIGSIMIELMEPATSILDPGSVILKEPDKWRKESGIKDFLERTQHRTLRELKEHPFLPPKPQGSWLQSHIFAAVRAANVAWDKPSFS